VSYVRVYVFLTKVFSRLNISSFRWEPPYSNWRALYTFSTEFIRERRHEITTGKSDFRLGPIAGLDETKFGRRNISPERTGGARWTSTPYIASWTSLGRQCSSIFFYRARVYCIIIYYRCERHHTGGKKRVGFERNGAAHIIPACVRTYIYIYIRTGI